MDMAKAAVVEDAGGVAEERWDVKDYFLTKTC
jgi:hypothetical protein